MNVFYSVWELDTVFFVQIYCYPKALYNRHVVVLFETSVLKKSLFYVRYLRNNITVMLIPKVQSKQSFYCLNFLKEKLFADTLLLHFLVLWMFYIFLYT